MVNESTNAVDNVCLWDGNPATWQPPAGYLMLVQATTMAVVWVFDKTIEDYVLEQQMGQGQIGFTWDGTQCTTNQPKPPKPTHPAVDGAQVL